MPTATPQPTAELTGLIAFRSRLDDIRTTVNAIDAVLAKDAAPVPLVLAQAFVVVDRLASDLASVAERLGMASGTGRPPWDS